jgi:hypothetical protein
MDNKEKKLTKAYSKFGYIGKRKTRDSVKEWREQRRQEYNAKHRNKPKKQVTVKKDDKKLENDYGYYLMRQAQ